MIMFVQPKVMRLLLALSIMLSSLAGQSNIAAAQSSALEINSASQLEDTPTQASEKTEQEETTQTTVTDLIKKGNNAYVEAEFEQAIDFYSQAIDLFRQGF